jgi:hypothetical protein
MRTVPAPQTVAAIAGDDRISLAGFRAVAGVLAALTAAELVRGGVIGFGDKQTWDLFRRDRLAFFLCADPATSGRLWSLVAARFGSNLSPEIPR